jgi:hypothetical protein
VARFRHPSHNAAQRTSQIANHVKHLDGSEPYKTCVVSIEAVITNLQIRPVIASLATFRRKIRFSEKLPGPPSR